MAQKIGQTFGVCLFVCAFLTARCGNLVTRLINSEESTQQGNAASTGYLQNLSVSTGTLTPAFQPATTSYSLNVGYGTASLVLTAATAANDSITLVRINGSTACSGAGASWTCSLTSTSNPIEIFLSSGGSTLTYNLLVAVTGNASGPLSSGTIAHALGLAGTVTTYAGPIPASIASGSSDGTGSGAAFNAPHGITTDGRNLYVSDKNNHTIRRVDLSSGAVTTIAGAVGSALLANGTLGVNRLNTPQGLTTDGNYLYICDAGNTAIRVLALASGNLSTLVQDAANLPACYSLVLSGTSLYVTNNSSGLSVSEISTLTGSITPVISGTGHTFSGITAIGSVLYLTDTQLHNVYSAAIGSFSLVLVAGNGSPGYSDATGNLASFDGPNDLTHDGTDLFLTDNTNHAIRRISPGTGAVTTVISGGVGYQNSAPGPVQFNTIRGIVSDGANIYVCDRGSNAIRKIQ